MTDQEVKDPQLEPKRPETLTFRYASSVQYASTPFDLKMLFGDSVVDLTTGEATVKQHTGITLSWEQAKVAFLFLYVNVNIFEAEHGEIKISKLALSPAVQERVSKPYLTFNEALQAVKETLAGATPGGEEGKHLS